MVENPRVPKCPREGCGKDRHTDSSGKVIAYCIECRRIVNRERYHKLKKKKA